jgi:hypothetical protein
MAKGSAIVMAKLLAKLLATLVRASALWRRLLPETTA